MCLDSGVQIEPIDLGASALSMKGGAIRYHYKDTIRSTIRYYEGSHKGTINYDKGTIGYYKGHGFGFRVL